MLDRGPHHRCGALGAEGTAAFAAIEEGVHLLAHHIGGLTDAAAKQLGDLQHGRADLLHTGAAELVPSEGFHLLPQGGLLGQQIHHAPQALELLHRYPTAKPSLQGRLSLLTKRAVHPWRNC